jgi:hypothetical protein
LHGTDCHLRQRTSRKLVTQVENGICLGANGCEN